jgi:hypothetical protein
MRVLNFYKYLSEKEEANDPLSSDEFTFNNGLFGGTVFKSNRKMDPIDISQGSDLLSEDDKVVLGIRNWKQITGIKSKRKKGTSDKYKKIVLEGRGGKEKTYFEGDEGYDAAVRFVEAIKSSLETAEKKGTDPDFSKTGNTEGKDGKGMTSLSPDEVTYRLLLDKALSALVMMRAILPAKAPEDRPEIGDLLGKFNIYQKIADILASTTPKKESHAKMWDSIKSLGSDSEKYIQEFATVWGQAQGKPEEETRSEMTARGTEDIKRAKEKYTVSGNGAAKYIKAAVDSYSRGGLNLLDSGKINLDALQPSIKELKQRFEKDSSAGSVSEGNTLTESMKTAVNYSAVYERKKSDDSEISQTQDLSYSTLLNQVISLASLIDNFIDFFNGSPYEGEIKASAKKYQTPLQKAAQFLSSNDFSKIRNTPAASSKLSQISDDVAKLSAPKGEMSIQEWKNSSLEKYGDLQVSNEFLIDGDRKMAQAQNIINDMTKISALKKKQANTELDRVISNLSKTQEEYDQEKKIDRIGGGGGFDVVDTDGNLTKDGVKDLQNNISQILGTENINSGDYNPETETNSLEVARHLSMLNGKSYKDKSGKLDLNALNRDMKIFLRNRDSLKSQMGIETKGSKSQKGEVPNKPADKKEDTQGKKSGGKANTTQKAKDKKREAMAILEDLIKNASGLGAEKKKDKWSSSLENLKKTSDEELCTEANIKKISDQKASAKKDLDENRMFLTKAEQAKCEKLIAMLDEYPTYCEV